MNAQELLQEISDYCRHTGLAESTFGRRAVNDGKLASRLRHGGRITTEKLDRNRNAAARPTVIARAQPQETPPAQRAIAPINPMAPSISPASSTASTTGAD